ncbi:hypothetical protein [Neobacillus sp. LXY-4]
MMDKETSYVAAELSPNMINELKSFEEKLSQGSDKKLVVIAYEKDDDQ